MGRLIVHLAALVGLCLGPPARAQIPLAPERPGVQDVYFVGFAGWGDQSVFLSEARGAAEVVAKAYDSAGRALILSNDPASGGRPARAAELEAALKAVSRTMNPQEDVLFLLLTSHGSRRGIALQAGGRALGELSPGALRSALERAGIRKTVLVVSACYSGVFTRLAGPTRLVITAARRDRPSFGCQDGNRWTYFGEAFFGAALPSARDPRAAHVLAVRLVTERERREGFTPSEPQIAGGGRLRLAP